jgi:hypothetical protein
MDAMFEARGQKDEAAREKYNNRMEALFLKYEKMAEAPVSAPAPSSAQVEKRGEGASGYQPVPGIAPLSILDDINEYEHIDEYGDDDGQDGDVQDDDGQDGYEQEPETAMFDQANNKKKLVPSDGQKRRWADFRHIGPEYAKDDWTNVKVAAVVSTHVGHKEAVDFKSYEADPEMELRYDNEKAQEKILKEAEELFGGIAAAITTVMEVTETSVLAMDEASQAFLGSEKMPDPRQLAGETVLDMKVG